MPEYLELESGGFLELEAEGNLELEIGAVFVVGNANSFVARTQQRGWTIVAPVILSPVEQPTVLAIAPQDGTWH